VSAKKPMPIRPVISLASLASMTTLEAPTPARVLSPIQKAELGKVYEWLEKVAESQFRGAVTLHFNGQGWVEKAVELRAKILLDTGREKG